MNRWLPPPNVSVSTHGDYERWELLLDAGDRQDDFLGDLGNRVIDAYMIPFHALRTIGIGSLDMERACGRLFDGEGHPTDTFVEFAGEVIAAWAEQSYARNDVVRDPVPHDTTPVFDALAIEREHGNVYVRFVQAKTTESYPATGANEAVVKFGKLEAGAYFRELTTALEDVASCLTDANEKRAVLRASIDPAVRRYRIVVTHGVEAPPRAPTNFNTHVTGNRSRRGTTYLKMSEWDAAWTLVGEKAREKAIEQFG